MNRKQLLAEVAIEINRDPQYAETITLGVLEALHAQVTDQEALELASQLPAGLRGPWLEARAHGRCASTAIRGREFIDQVQKIAALSDHTEAKRAVLAVFAVLDRALTAEGASNAHPKTKEKRFAQA